MSPSDPSPHAARSRRSVLIRVLAVVAIAGAIAIGIGMVVDSLPSAAEGDPMLLIFGVAVIVSGLWSLLQLTRKSEPRPVREESRDGAQPWWLYRIGGAFVVLLGAFPLVRAIGELAAGTATLESLYDALIGGAFCAIGSAMLVGVSLVRQRWTLRRDGSAALEGQRRLADEAPAWRAAILGISFLFLLFFLPGEEPSGSPWYLALAAVLLLPLGLVVRSWMREGRFGKSSLVFHRSPLRPGKPVQGVVETQIDPARLHGENIRATIVITAIKSVSTRHAGTTLDVIWREENTVPAERMKRTAEGVAIPFDFDLPEDAPRSISAGRQSIRWKLRAGIVLPGVDYVAEFEFRVE
jgi:hypothetical protein